MKKVIFLLLCVLLLSGCASHGTEEQMMVVLLGVDPAPDGNIKVIVKVPSFSGGSDSGSSGDGYLTLTASGETFSSALTLLHATAPRKLNYSQTRQILLNQDVLISCPDIIRTLGLVDGMRSQTTVSVCKEKAEDVISAEKAVIGTRLSRYIDTTLETGVREGYIPDSTLIRVLTQMGGGYQDALLALSGLSQKDRQDQLEQQQNAAPAMNQSTDSLAGDMSHISGKVVQWMGSAALDGDRYSGLLTGFETTLCRFLTQEIGVLPFETGDGVLSCTARYGPHLSVRKSESGYVFLIRADLNVLPKYGMTPDLDALDQAITQAVTQLVSTLQNLHCDALGFGGIAARDYLTLPEWESSHWKDAYTNAAVEADIRITLVNE